MHRPAGAAGSASRRPTQAPSTRPPPATSTCTAVSTTPSTAEPLHLAEMLLC